MEKEQTSSKQSQFSSPLSSISNAPISASLQPNSAHLTLSQQPNTYQCIGAPSDSNNAANNHNSIIINKQHRF
jgi:hypothetical protein